jgi:HEAT repeats
MMPTTMDDVIRFLLPDEADLDRVARFLGVEALPHLAALVDGDDANLATKATWVAGLIPDPRGAEIVLRAAQHADRAVRMVAAAVAQRMPPAHTASILTTLLRDDDGETRGLAIQAVQPGAPPEVQAALAGMADQEPNAYLRGRSEEALQRLKE